MEIALRSEKIYIANKPIDFRKGIDGLCTLVIEVWALKETDPPNAHHILILLYQ